MKKIISTLTLLLIIYIPLNAQNIEQIISKFVKAKGGYQKLLSVHSQRLTGTITFSTNESGPFSVTIEHPFKMREEMEINGKKIIRVLNGNSGWILNPFSSKKDAQPLPLKIVEDMRGAADFNGPLVDYKAKGNVIKYLGKDTANGKLAYKLKVIQKDSIVGYQYIDCTTGLELKWEGKIGAEGKGHLMQSLFGNYKKVDGIMYSFDILSGTPEQPVEQHIIINKVEVNPKLNEDLFTKPVSSKEDSTKVK